MEINVANEAFVFLCSLPLGAVIAAIYDFFRMLRIVFSKKRFVIFFEDLIFWAITAVIMVLFCFVFTNGCVRGYVFLGAMLGAAIYLSTVSVAVLGALRFCADKTRAFFVRKTRFFANWLGIKLKNVKNKGKN